MSLMSLAGKAGVSLCILQGILITPLALKTLFITSGRSIIEYLWVFTLFLPLLAIILLMCCRMWAARLLAVFVFMQILMVLRTVIKAGGLMVSDIKVSGLILLFVLPFTAAALLYCGEGPLRNLKRA